MARSRRARHGRDDRRARTASQVACAAREIGFWLVEHDVFASDRHVCAISTIGARRSSMEVETRVISIFRYHEGRQVERWFYPDDTAAWNTIFAV